MTLKGIDKVDLDYIQPGYIIELKISKQSFISKMMEKSKNIGCTLMSLNYGVFYFKEKHIDPNKREEIIDTILYK